jgi:hypothetical protein
MSLFSDSESTGSGRSEGEAEQAMVWDGDSGYDEAWLHGMVEQVDVWMKLSTPALYSKWQALNTMTLMYHRSLRDMSVELEREELQVHLLRESYARLAAEKDRVAALLTQAVSEKERAEGLLRCIDAMTQEEMSKWEYVDSDSDCG